MSTMPIDNAAATRSHRRLMSVPEIIDALGGYRVVAKALGLSRHSVGSMRRRRHINVVHWSALIGLAATRDIPLSHRDLTIIHTAERKRRSLVKRTD